MALKILTQILPQPVTQTVPAIPIEKTVQTEAEVLTQEYIALYRVFDAQQVKPLVKKMEEIKKKLQLIANETMEGQKPAIFTCEAGEVEFSERSEVTEVIDPQTLISHLAGKFGMDVAMSVVDIALTPLRQILSEYELGPFVKKEPGSRTLKSVRPVKE